MPTVSCSGPFLSSRNSKNTKKNEGPGLFCHKKLQKCQQSRALDAFSVAEVPKIQKNGGSGPFLLFKRSKNANSLLLWAFLSSKNSRNLQQYRAPGCLCPWKCSGGPLGASEASGGPLKGRPRVPPRIDQKWSVVNKIVMLERTFFEASRLGS